MNGTYKYTIQMPPAERSIEYIKKQFTEEKLDQLLDNKIECLISPVFRREDGSTYYMPVIDIDYKQSSAGSAFVILRKILYNIYLEKFGLSKTPYKLKDFIVEYTGTGYHLVMNKAFLTTNDELTKYRKLCSRWTTGIDCVSSFRETPIRRIGGFKNYVIYPIPAEQFLKLKKEPKKYKTHLEVLHKEEWKEVLLKWLIPKNFVDEKFDVQIINDV